MIKEHALMITGHISPANLEYLCRKANQHGMKGHELVRTYSEIDEEGTHIYFEFKGVYHATQQGQEQESNLGEYPY